MNPTSVTNFCSPSISQVYPKGMYNLLMWIHREYNGPEIIITENGVSDRGGLEDFARVDYHNQYLGAALDAIEDGANISGYIIWSLMDSYEWKAGFTEKFGLYHVDFNSPNRTRTPKISARVFANICKTSSIDLDYRPTLDEEQLVAAARLPEEMSPNSASAVTLGWSLTLLACVGVALLRL